MSLKQVLVAVISIAATVSAAPTTKAKSITSDCTDIELRDTWLVANCLNDQGARIQSAVYLPYKINNTEGNMKWAENGEYVNSCSDCKLINGVELNCQCSPPWTGNVNSTLNLEEHIKSYDGHLIADFPGVPTVPSTNSSVSIPTSWDWNVYQGATGCYTTGTPSSTCPLPNPTDFTCPAAAFWTSTRGEPVKCGSFHYPIYLPMYSSFQSISADTLADAWELVVYDTVDCSTPPIATFSPAEYKTCNKLNKTAVAFAMKPLFNADY